MTNWFDEHEEGPTRKVSRREWFLLAVYYVVAVGGAYVWTLTH